MKKYLVTLTANNIIEGEYDYDCICVELDKKPIQICFHKKDNIKQFEGKQVYIIFDDGKYSIKEYRETEKTKSYK